jgi:uncharacterized membrane protein YhaH (DUF805 family)
LNPNPLQGDTFPNAGSPVLSHAGRSWKSCSNSCSAPRGASTGPILALAVIFTVAGLFAAVILFAAAAIAAPLFIVMVVIVFIPWLMWGFAIQTERLHDRNKSAWWLLAFYVMPGVLGHFAKAAWFAGGAGMALHYVLALASFALTIWGFVEIGCLGGTAGPNKYGSFRSPAERQGAHSAAHADIQRRDPGKQKKPDGRFGHRASEFREAWNFPILILIDLRLLNLHRQTFT